MSKIKYSPDTHFFVDHANLATPLPANLATDAYGPVNGSATTKFSTTSVIRVSALSAVYAICDGQLLIQPHTGDATKVNLILKTIRIFCSVKNQVLYL